MKKGLAVLITLILGLGALSNAYADYTYTSLDYPGASGTVAAGINNAGTIVGWYTDASGVAHGYVLSNGISTALNYPGALWTKAAGINDSGTIVGTYRNATGKNHAFSLTGTTYTPLDYPGAKGTYINGNAINNGGTIVGGYHVSATDMDYGFVLSGPTYTSFSYPGASTTWADSINNGGTIVGGYYNASGVTQGFSLSGTTFTPVDYPSAPETEAMGINDAGMIVGEYADASGVWHGFVLSGGTYAALNYPDASAIQNSYVNFAGTAAVSINNAGTIVGAYTDASGVAHGFLATPGPSITVVDSGTGTGTVTSTPSGINCGDTCSADYKSGTSVTLTATPASGSTFTGWSGACRNATGTCAVAVTGPETVTAHYIITGISTFSDVSISSLYESYIEAIYNNGITTGCGNGDYCPSEQVTRDQMAAFLVRGTQVAEGKSTVNFTCNGGAAGASVACATTTPYFNDVPATDSFFPYVQKLYELGITTGCGNNDYCPLENVSRDQMAAFLVRGTQAAAGQSTVNFTCNGGANCATETPYFNDVPATDSFFPYVQKLKELGITTGCGNGNYCPLENVTRDQMAAFLARAFLGMH